MHDDSAQRSCHMTRMLHGTVPWYGTIVPLVDLRETPPPRAHAFCDQGEDRRADDMSSNNMAKLVSRRRERSSRLSEFAAVPSITIVNSVDGHRRRHAIKGRFSVKPDLEDDPGTPLPRTGQDPRGAEGPGRAACRTLREEGLPRGAALDDTFAPRWRRRLTSWASLCVDAARLMGTHLAVSCEAARDDLGGARGPAAAGPLGG